MHAFRTFSVLALLASLALLGCGDLATVPSVETVKAFDRPIGGMHDHGGGDDDDGGGDLVEVGRALFFEETFNGNGRTCGTCHRENNNMGLDVDFIQARHDTHGPDKFVTGDPTDPQFDQFDLLFIAELTSTQQEALDPDLSLPPVDLPPFILGGDPNAPAFESPALMLARGLILENIHGVPPVFRSSPSLFNVSLTAPFGWSAAAETLEEFTVGAVAQHFTRTLARVPGEDFRLPTLDELEAMAAFMMSLQLPADGDFRLPRGNPNRPEVADRNTFASVGCGICHRGTVLAGNTFATGVESLPAPDGLPSVPTLDIGAGDPTMPPSFTNPPSFQTPPLFGLLKPFFFHNNAVKGLENAVRFYDSDEFRASPSELDINFDDDPVIKEQQILAIVRFLTALQN